MNKRNFKFLAIRIALFFMILGLIGDVYLITYLNWVGMNFKMIMIISINTFCMLYLTSFFFGSTHSRNDTYKMHAFLNNLIIVYIIGLADILCNFAQGHSQFRNEVAVLYMVMVFLTNAASLSMLGFTSRIIKGKTRRSFTELLIVSLVVGALTVFYLSNYKHGLLFTVDESANLIIHWPLGYSYMLSGMVVNFISVLMALASNVSKKQKMVIILYNSVPYGVVILCSVVLKCNLIVSGLTAAIIIGHNAFYNELDRDNAAILKTFERFLSDDVVDHLIKKNGTALEKPQKKMATIMYCDIRGFTAISQRLFPSKLVDMINHYFGVVTEIIENNEGAVLEFLGDGFTAVFGAPTYVKNYPEHAVAAAIQIQNAVDGINDWNKKMGYPDIQVGIGINTGEITLGSFGSHNKAVYKAIGDEADFAAYIEGLSFGGSILISRSTLDELHCPHDSRRIYHLDGDDYDRGNDIFYVKELGSPYNVATRYREYSPQKLENPYPYTFHIFINKRRDETDRQCEIIELSENHIKIRTKEDLCNVKEVDFSDRYYNYLYAKTIRQEGDEAEFTFTSKPNDFKKWYTKILNFKKAEKSVSE